MPRESKFSNDTLAERALHQFWTKGFYATSMDELVRSTGASRHGIYTAFGGKKLLFYACFQRYQDLIVTPAFSRVEKPDAGLAAIAAYFETQIALGEASGLPGPGCFVANSSTEVAPHDAQTLAKVAEHNLRLHNGFKNALQNERKADGYIGQTDINLLAEVFVVFTNGLWSRSRTATNAAVLRQSVATFLNSMEAELT